VEQPSTDGAATDSIGDTNEFTPVPPPYRTPTGMIVGLVFGFLGLCALVAGGVAYMMMRKSGASTSFDMGDDFYQQQEAFELAAVNAPVTTRLEEDEFASQENPLYDAGLMDELELFDESDEGEVVAAAKDAEAPKTE
jgi:hypothetical protein